MVRSQFPGSTDYSIQSFDDMLTDLGCWISSLSNTVRILTENQNLLIEAGYWNIVDYDFRTLVARALLFFNTVEKELTEIKSQLVSEVRLDHVSRLSSLGHSAKEMEREVAHVWKDLYQHKDYGNQHFDCVERMYEECRERSYDLWDLSNVASRLQEFVGRGMSGCETTESRIQGPVFNFNNTQVGQINAPSGQVALVEAGGGTITGDMTSESDQPASSENSGKLDLSSIVAVAVPLCVVALFELLIRWLNWHWLLDHPNSLGLQLSFSGSLICFIVGLICTRHRSWWWGVALIAILTTVPQMVDVPH